MPIFTEFPAQKSQDMQQCLRKEEDKPVRRERKVCSGALSGHAVGAQIQAVTWRIVLWIRTGYDVGQVRSTNDVSW